MKFAALIIFVSTSAFAQNDDPWLSPDKGLHFAVSAGIASAGYAGAAIFTRDVHWKFAIGLALSLAAATGKEMLDAFRPGSDSSYKDLAFDALGIATGLAVSWLVDFLIQKFAPTPAVVGARPCHNSANASWQPWLTGCPG